MDLLHKILLPSVLVYSLITVLFFLFNDYSISPFLPILPVVYGLVFAMVYLYRKESFKSIAVSIIFAIWLLRMVLVPFVFMISGYESLINVEAGVNNLNSAAILMSYEFLFVGFLINVNKNINLISKQNILSSQSYSKNSNKLNFVVILGMLFFAMGCVFYDNSVLAAISSIFDKLIHDVDVDIERRRQILDAYGSSKLVFSLFLNSVFYLQILLPAYLLSLIIPQGKYEKGKGLFFSLFVVVGSLLVTTDNNIDSVNVMLATTLVVFLAYFQIMRRFIAPLCLLGLGFIFLFLFQKTGTQIVPGKSFFSSISPILCAYFASIPNVSAGFSIVYDDKLATFFGDVVAGVPYMMAFFKGLPKSVTLYNEVVHGYSGEVNQIVPLITSGFHYLGILAPMFTVIVYGITFRMELFLKNAKCVFSQVLYAFFVVNLAVGPCIFGFPNTIKRLCLFLPLFVLAYINDNKC